MSQLKNSRKLKTIDDLIESCSDTQRGESPQHSQQKLEIKSLVPFADHPFSLYEGERLDDMVASIKNNGVLVPIIVRKKPGESSYEILSGHNRVNAAKLADLDEVPAIILENVTDEDALVYVIETNLMQRSFTDMKHIEKAAVIAMHHSKMFSQGKRNDIMAMLDALENNDAPTFCQSGKKLSSDEAATGIANLTFCQSGKKLNSHEAIGEMYGLSVSTIARYIRINKLSDLLKKRLDNGDIGFIQAVSLSYLTADEQSMIDTYLETDNVKIDVKKAETLRRCSQEGLLDETTLGMILEDSLHQAKAKKVMPNIKIKKAILEKYFSADVSIEKIEEDIELALAFYFENKAGKSA